jgi:hypothetical protein
MIFTAVHWFSWLFIDFVLYFIDFQWLSLIFIVFAWIFTNAKFDLHRFGLPFHRCLLIFAYARCQEIGAIPTTDIRCGRGRIPKDAVRRRKDKSNFDKTWFKSMYRMKSIFGWVPTLYDDKIIISDAFSVNTHWKLPTLWYFNFSVRMLSNWLNRISADRWHIETDRPVPTLVWGHANVLPCVFLLAGPYSNVIRTAHGCIQAGPYTGRPMQYTGRRAYWLAYTQAGPYTSQP